MGIFDLFSDVTEVVKDVADIATAPVELAVGLVKPVTKEISEGVQSLVQDVKDLSK